MQIKVAGENFNTSHVNVNRFPTFPTYQPYCISIHLMLMLIMKVKTEVMLEPISIHLMLMLIDMNNIKF